MPTYIAITGTQEQVRAPSSANQLTAPVQPDMHPQTAEGLPSYYIPLAPEYAPYAADHYIPGVPSRQRTGMWSAPGSWNRIGGPYVSRLSETAPQTSPQAYQSGLPYARLHAPVIPRRYIETNTDISLTRLGAAGGQSGQTGNQDSRLYRRLRAPRWQEGWALDNY